MGSFPKKVGLYFGSFNPLTHGHLISAHEALGFVDQVWFVLSPENPHKDPNGLLSDGARFLMLSHELSDQENMDVECIEMDMPKPSYTIDTLKKLEIENPEIEEFVIISGTDSYLSIPTWKSGKEIISNYNFIVVKRGEEDFDLFKESDLKTEGYSTISSTVVREKIKQRKPFEHLVPKEVANWINKNNYYK